MTTVFVASNVAQDKIVGIADIKVGKAPGIISTNLGSCIAVCLYSSRHQAGGMLHLMLATAGNGDPKTILKKAKYADTGIPELLRELKTNFGLEASDLTAKIFGGAKILQNVSHNIGLENETAVRAILKELNIRILASQTGGEKGYKVQMDLSMGKVRCQVFGGEIREY